jgi:DNA polymerase epsilon subunit 4
MMVEPNTPTLPQSRVKKIMKMDDDSLLVREETVATMTKATELFVDYLVKESIKENSKEKLSYKALSETVHAIPALAFLREVVPEKVSGEYLLFRDASREQGE